MKSANVTRRIIETLSVQHPNADTELVHRNAFELLVATILSAQSTDARVNLVTQALFARYPDARTLAKAIREHLSETAPFLQQIADAYGTPQFAEVFREVYPKCENISIDYAVLEPRSTKGEHHSNLYCLRAEFGWNDLGSWAALYEHQLELRANTDKHANVSESAGSLALDAQGNYVYSPKKFVALVGIRDLVVVETDDAILITTRHHSQEVGKVVKELAANGRKELI